MSPSFVCVEIGSWHGRSSRAIADNLPEGGILICCDSWNGSSGEPDQHATAKLREGDHAFSWWLCNLWTHVIAGRVIPIRAHSVNAAETLKHLGLKVDVCFIDADHSHQGVRDDIAAWAPLMKEGGIMCGHDYYTVGEEPFAWIGVRETVEDMFPDAQKVATSIWWSRSKPKIKQTVIDCVPLFDELDLLELRFNELDSVVDRFVVAEAVLSHSGQPKPLYLKESIERESDRWAKWLPKLTHIFVDDFNLDGLSGSDQHWAIERHQRDSLMRGLTECKDDDVITISDTDEIPNAEAIKSYSVDLGICALEMRLFYGYMNFEGYEPWRWTRILPYKILKEISPCGARYVPNYDPETQVIRNGGNHFSFMGGPDEWVKKLNNSPHQEYNTPEINNKDRMVQNVQEGRDLLGRDIPYRFVPVDESYPEFVTKNLQRFIDNEFIYVNPEEVMHPESYQFVEMVKSQYPDFFHDKKVLEVGSLDINGSVRQFFENCDYTGIDLAEGLGVDRVVHVVDLLKECTEISPGHFADVPYPRLNDVVISSEALEHDERWKESLPAMVQLLKPGGLLVISCAGPARPEHGTTRTDIYSSPFTTDYYRNISKEDFLGALPSDLFSECTIGYDRGEEDLHFWGIKQSTPASFLKDTASVIPSEVIHMVSDGENWQPNVTQPEHSQSLAHKKNWTVTAEVSTKDRYHVLPLCLSAIITQTHKPDKLVIYDDGEQKDLREISPFKGLLAIADQRGIKWEIFATPRKGQVTNHQHCLDNADTDFILRCDDDVILMPDCLERLLNSIRDYGRGGEFDSIGAVAPLIHHAGEVGPPPEFLDGSLNDVKAGLNLQWYQFNGGSREASHLYSSFLVNVSAARKAGGYPKTLSQIGHHEETILSHSIHRAGYKLLIEPSAVAHHLREPTGGIRSFTDKSLWEHDEQVFQSYLAEWGMNGGRPTKLIVLDCGVGDTFAFKSILPLLKERHKDKELILAVCYPEILEDEGLKLISIADAKTVLGKRYDDANPYKFFWASCNKKPLSEAMLEFWG